MKNIFVSGIMGVISICAVFPALADNLTVEDAIKRRSDLSSFYQALINTGVNHELQSSVAYTVFAPTNEAFAKIAPDRYPCFYSASCRLEIADIVRNHIVPGEIHIQDAANQKGGLYSIDKRFVTIGEPSRNNYTVDGKNITSANLLAGSMLYKIDGVIANERELAMFEYPRYAYVLPGEQVTTTTVSRTTTPVIIPIPTAAPAR